MDQEYKAFKCPSCRGEMIAIIADLERMDLDGRYKACIYCGCRFLVETGKYDSLLECMSKVRPWRDDKL